MKVHNNLWQGVGQVIGSTFCKDDFGKVQYRFNEVVQERSLHISVEWSTPMGILVAHHLLFFISTALRPLSLCLLGHFPNTWIPPHAYLRLPLLLLSCVSSLQQGAQEPWRTEESGPKQKVLLTLFRSTFCDPAAEVAPACSQHSTRREVIGLSSALNLIQDGGMHHLLRMIGLDVCFKELK